MVTTGAATLIASASENVKRVNEAPTERQAREYRSLCVNNCAKFSFDFTLFVNVSVMPQKNDGN
jgi:hypothetical protein